MQGGFAVLSGKTSFEVLTVDKPSLKVLTTIRFNPKMVATDIASFIRWTGRKSCSLAPIDVDEPRRMQQVGAKLFEVSARKPVKANSHLV